MNKWVIIKGFTFNIEDSEEYYDDLDYYDLRGFNIYDNFDKLNGFDCYNTYYNYIDRMDKFSSIFHHLFGDILSKTDGYYLDCEGRVYHDCYVIIMDKII
jgi:hypothetical protein